MCRCGSPPMLFIMIPNFLAEDNANPKHVINGSERILLFMAIECSEKITTLINCTCIAPANQPCNQRNTESI